MALFDNLRSTFAELYSVAGERIGHLFAGRFLPANSGIPGKERDGTHDLERTVAPWPQIDRWPILLGSNLTFQYLASVRRLCQQGYRQQYVDVLNELLEKDPHAYAVLAQRILAVSGGSVEITAAELPEDANDAEKDRAKEIRSLVEQRIQAIPALSQALFALLWGIYYGLTAAEIQWDRRNDGWWISGLEMIHSRRLNYPDQNAWDLHVWDQGAVLPFAPVAFPTEGLYGLRVKDYPGKFLIFGDGPSYRGDYPTREGVGRQVDYYMAIKQMAVRGATQYVERFAKPWALGYYNTKGPDGKDRDAGESDRTALDAALKGLGIGGLASAALPSSVRVELQGPAVGGSGGGRSSINQLTLVKLCDDQVSKAVRGGTLTTDAGEKGARSLGQVHQEGDLRNARYDASILAQALKEDLVWWIVHLNCPGEERLCPGVKIHVEQVSPEQILERAAKMAALGAGPDAQWLADKLGQKLADLTEEGARRLAPIKPVEIGMLDPPKETADSVAEGIQALAAHLGITLTPTVKNAVAALSRERAAQFLRELLMSAAKSSADSSAPIVTPQSDPVNGAPPRSPALPIQPTTDSHEE